MTNIENEGDTKISADKSKQTSRQTKGKSNNFSIKQIST